MFDVTIRHPQANDRQAFITAMQTSINLHHPWTAAPINQAEFNAYLEKYNSSNNVSYLVLADNAIAGVVNLNEIVRGCFQNAFLGYYAVQAFSGQGIMTQGLQQVITAAFGEHQLHRLEANIQPDNTASIRLVQRCGFVKEGYSAAYLKINGEWRDHERWALVAAVDHSTTCNPPVT